MNLHTKLQLLCFALLGAHLLTGDPSLIVFGWLSISALDFSHSRRVLKGSMGKKNKKTKSGILVLSSLSDIAVSASFYFGLEQDNFYWVKWSTLAILLIVCLIDDDIDGHFGKLKKGAKSVFWMGRYREIRHA